MRHFLEEPDRYPTNKMKKKAFAVVPHPGKGGTKLDGGKLRAEKTGFLEGDENSRASFSPSSAHKS